MRIFTEWMSRIREINIRNGWRDPDGGPSVSFGESIALLHSEVSEALEAYRRWGMDDPAMPGEKPEGVGSEFADVLIRLLDYCDAFGVDLEWHVEEKLSYNAKRSYRHGGKRL